MRTGFKRLLFALAATLIVAGSTVAHAQNCPTSPNYTPDFSANQTCLGLNGFNFNAISSVYPGFYPAVSTSATVLRLTPNQPYWVGTAWYNAQQSVAGAFTTTFAFQLTGNSQYGSADGIAFVIQNSPAGTTAAGPEGCGIGFGGSSSGCTPALGPQTGITNSLAVEFNTFPNPNVDPSGNSVSIQNCGGTGANSVDPSCTVASNANLPLTLADGNIHIVTVNYSGPSTKLLDVIIDSNDLFPGGVTFDLTTLGLANGNAWLGFTGSTGDAFSTQDILSWTFTPGAQTAVISQTSPTSLNFPNAAGSNVYSATAQLTAPYSTPEIQVQPILMSQSACDALVQVNFWPARCFVYENAENSGMNAAVMFSVTCPTSPGGTCGSNTNQFFAELGTVFEFAQAQNPYFIYPGILGPLNPFPGWLKGAGPNPLAPCTPPSSGPLFQSNQIDTFFIDNGTTKGKSAGTGSCWVATYDTPGEIWPGVTISSPQPTTYKLNQVVTANYTCSNPSTSKPLTSPTGPYLTAAVCTQATGTQNSCTQTSSGLTCTGTVVTSTKGLHIFEVTGIDSGGNQNLNAVIYNVK